MAIAHVQSVGAQSSGAVASLGATFAGAGTSGNRVRVAVIHYQVGTYTVTDTVNTYSQDVAKTEGNETASIWKADLTTGATLTVTVTNTSGNKYTSIGAAEFSGIDTGVSPQFSSGSSASASSLSSGALTAADDGALYFGSFVYGGSGTTITEAAPFSLVYENESASNEPISSTYYIQPTAASQAASWTLGASRACAACLTVDEAAAGGGGGAFLPLVNGGLVNFGLINGGLVG